MRALLFALPFALAACASEPADTPPADVEAIDAVDDAPVGEAAATAPKLNLNTASEAEFLAIPGVGERMAHEFEEYRPYVSIQQFRREIEKYVPADTVARYEEYVFVPVRVDESDAATLAQLPGVDDAAAQALVDGRPYGSRAAFLEALAAVVGPDDLAEAEAYLADS